MNNGNLTPELAEKLLNVKGDKRGMKTKLLWQDKNYREIMIQKHQIGKRQTIEYQQSQSKKIKQYFQNPIAKKQRREKQRLLWQDPEYRKHMSEAHKGYVMSVQQKEKISNANRKYQLNQCLICGKEVYRHKYCSQKCFGISRKGFKHSHETLQKMRNVERPKGIAHHNWQGGKSFEPYPLGWTKTYREQIRYRDKYTCQICGTPEIECNRKLSVHHIDYDKTNLKLENLITLCLKCHARTNYKDRKEWEDYFVMEEYKKLSEETAEFLLTEIFAKVDEGNEAIMTDIFTRFSNTFPEHMNLVNKIYQREVGRPFRTYIERTSKRGY